MACEVTVKIKNREKSTSEKLRVYSPVLADFTDPSIDDFVAKVAKNFGGDPMLNKVTVTIKLIED